MVIADVFLHTILLKNLFFTEGVFKGTIIFLYPRFSRFLLFIKIKYFNFNRYIMQTLKNIFPDSFENIGVFLLILACTFVINWLVLTAFKRFMKFRTIDAHTDVTNYKFLGNALSSIIFMIGFMFAIREYPPLKAVASSLLAGAGILAAIIGFASQQAFSNIISGIFLIIFKPFRVNDHLRIKDIYAGVVEDITLRHTIIRDSENRRIIVPNAVINSEILINADYNDDEICKYIDFNIAHNADVEKAKHIMAEEIGNHPKFFDRRTDNQKAEGTSKVSVRLTQLTDFGMVIRGAAWTRTPAEAGDLYADLLESIKKRFDTEGVEIAFPRAQKEKL